MFVVFFNDRRCVFFALPWGPLTLLLFPLLADIGFGRTGCFDKVVGMGAGVEPGLRGFGPRRGELRFFHFAMAYPFWPASVLTKLMSSRSWPVQAACWCAFLALPGRKVVFHHSMLNRWKGRTGFGETEFFTKRAGARCLFGSSFALSGRMVLFMDSMPYCFFAHIGFGEAVFSKKLAGARCILESTFALPGPKRFVQPSLPHGLFGQHWF